MGVGQWGGGGIWVFLGFLGWVGDGLAVVATGLGVGWWLVVGLGVGRWLGVGRGLCSGFGGGWGFGDKDGVEDDDDDEEEGGDDEGVEDDDEDGM